MTSLQQTIDWKNFIIPEVKKFLTTEFTFAPSVRGMFYFLFSKGLISNTQNVYKSFDKALVNARKNGVISMKSFADYSRSIVDIDDIYWSPGDFIQYHLDELGSLHKSYHDKIPPWHEQVYYIEIWIEKEANKGVLQSILKGRVIKDVLDIRIIPNKGWTSEHSTFQHDNTQRLLKKKKKGRLVHVLYIGDYDPSGLRMSKKLKLALEKLGISFERIALTKAQIREFDLSHFRNPDPKVMEKLKRDPNRFDFMREHNRELYQIEVDALQKDPERFKTLVLEAVDKYFDWDTYSEVVAEYSKKDVYDMVTTELQEFLNNRPEYEEEGD